MKKTITSIESPLRIAEVKVPLGKRGVIGMTLCPGKRDEKGVSGSWARDLTLDMEVIRDWGADALVTLMEDFELDMLAVRKLPEIAKSHGIRWYHLPIVDVSVPDKCFEKDWATKGNELRNILYNGGRIVIHCRGGLGRTGIIAARILVEFGIEPGEAIKVVRTARPGAIQTIEQEEYVRRCQSLISSK